MLLDDKVALVFGAGGAIGGAVARRFAAEGATVYLSGHTLSSVQAVADDIRAAGGEARVAQVDATNEAEVEDYVSQVAQEAGRVSVVLNAVGIRARFGVPLLDIPLADFVDPISVWTSTQLLTARAAARHMPRGEGVILLLSGSPARLALPGRGGFAVACASIEALGRSLAAELGPQGTRVVCLRPHRIDDTLEASNPPMPVDGLRAGLESTTLLKRLPSLADVAGTAAFLASDGASAMTATVADLSCGSNVY